MLELRPDPVKEKNAKTQTKESANFFARVEGFWLYALGTFSVLRLILGLY